MVSRAACDGDDEHPECRLPNLLTNLLTDDLLSGVIHRYGLLGRFCKSPIQVHFLVLVGTGWNGLARAGGPKVGSSNLPSPTNKSTGQSTFLT